MAPTQQQPTLTPISWGRAKGQMVVDTPRHLHDPESAAMRTACGVAIPSVIFRNYRQGATEIQRFFANSEDETAALAPCGRCHRKAPLA